MRGKRRLASTLAVGLVAACGAVRAENVDPAGDGSRFAWSENLGFVNLEPGGDGREGVEVGDARLTGWAWSENAGWISFACANTASCSSVDYGVTNDGAGRLSGFAWTENVGWISFSCESTGSCATTPYWVTVDPATGVFSGLAWGENVGWLTFGVGAARVVTSWRPGGPCTEPSALDQRPTATPLTVARDVGGTLTLKYEAAPSDVRSVYQGTLASLHVNGAYDHSSMGACAIVGSQVSVRMPASDAYFLVVASCGTRESSYGRDSSGAGRPTPPAALRCP